MLVSTFTVPEYEISSPTYHNFKSRYSRWKRSSEVLKEKHEFGLGINAFGRAFNFSMSHNKHLLAPNFKIEILRQNGTDVSKRSIENCHHYTGSVHQGGLAAFSNCGGLVCAFRWLSLHVALFVELSIATTNKGAFLVFLNKGVFTLANENVHKYPIICLSS